MSQPMLANARLLRAKELIESVLDEMDTSIIDCSCPEHIRHFNNYSDAQTATRLQAIVDRLSRDAHSESVMDLTHREARAHGLEGTIY